MYFSRECRIYRLQRESEGVMMVLTEKRPPEDGILTIAHLSSVIQRSTGAINF